MQREHWKDLMEIIGGAIDENQLRSILAPLNLEEPKVQAFWERTQKNFADGYREYVNNRISEINSRE